MKPNSRIEVEANIFCRENDSELRLLPLCALAYEMRNFQHIQRLGTNKVYPVSKKIYENYDILPNDVKQQVLKDRNINISFPDNTAWVNDYLKKLKDDAFTNDMTTELNVYLHNNFKYYHRAISQLCDFEFGDISDNDIPHQYYDLTEFNDYNFSDFSFDRYVTEQFKLINGYNDGESFINVKLENRLLPLDYVHQITKDNNDKFVHYMVLFIKSLSENIYSYKHNDLIDFGYEDLLSTYGDYYYDSLLNLYYAYS